MSSRCSLIIPAFNHAQLTRQCLETVLRTVRLEVEIFVVDDGSIEAIPEFESRVRVIRHESNSGFAAACNTGARAAHGEFLVFLNNDTIPHDGWLDALVDYAQRHPRVTVIGSQLLDVTGNIQHAGVKICQDRYPRHAYVGYPGDHPAVSKSRAMQAVSAACALVRRDAFDRVGGFDTAYRNGFEDVDLCLRIAELGHEIHYCAESVVTHLECFSEGRFWYAKPNADLYRERWRRRVQPDDLPFYLQDDLLRLGYDKQNPEANKSPELAYRLLRRRILETVHQITPSDASVLVASRGDPALLEMNGRIARHFPQSETGGYAGHHLADGAAMTAHFEEIRRQGVEYFVLPETSYWWLDYYKEFHDHLKSTARQITNGDSPCVVFELANPGGKRCAPAPREEDPRPLRKTLELVELAIAAGSSVAILSGGEDALELEGRRTQPLRESANSADAISGLEKLRSEGTQYLLVPAKEFWWLDLHETFRRYLETRASVVAHEAEGCVIYALVHPAWNRPAASKRVIAILATRNEEKCLAACLEHHIAQGVQVYVIDNGSTDRTVAIAEHYRGRGVVEIEHLPFEGVFRQTQIDRYRAKVAASLDADWIMNIDADEIRIPPRAGWTLAEAFAAVEAAGYNAVNFREFMFLPTQESPDHDHPRFQETMRSYYLFDQRCPWRINAWQAQPEPVQVNPHRVSFPGLRLCPEFFVLKHYQFLSAGHAAQKYGFRRHDPADLKAGMQGGSNGWREQYTGSSFPLPLASDLKTYCADKGWDLSEPRSSHYLEDVLARGATS